MKAFTGERNHALHRFSRICTIRRICRRTLDVFLTRRDPGSFQQVERSKAHERQLRETYKLPHPSHRLLQRTAITNNYLRRRPVPIHVMADLGKNPSCTRHPALKTSSARKCQTSKNGVFRGLPGHTKLVPVIKGAVMQAQLLRCAQIPRARHPLFHTGDVSQ
jgi:hypothetical protein